MIDVTKPLELSDGTRVDSVTLYKSGEQIRAYIGLEGRDFGLDGKPTISDWPAASLQFNGRTLRNVRQPATATGLEHLERLEALARRIATTAEIGAVWERSATLNRLSEEAREIVALLPPKTDEEWAIAIEAEVTGEKPWDDLIDMNREVARRAIAKGRELALAERGE